MNEKPNLRWTKMEDEMPPLEESVLLYLDGKYDFGYLTYEEEEDYDEYDEEDDDFDREEEFESGLDDEPILSWYSENTGEYTEFVLDGYWAFINEAPED